MDLKSADEKLDTVDSIFTKTEKLLKKHWKLLLFLLFAYGAYWFGGLVVDEMNKQEQQEQYQDTIP